MSLVGAGNWWDKKDKYSQCPNCDKKGYYNTSLVDKYGQIHKWNCCMFCKKTVIERNGAQVLYRLCYWLNMNGYSTLTGCNAYRFKLDDAPEHCDCHNCVSYALDIMEATKMEIAMEIKHG